MSKYTMELREIVENNIVLFDFTYDFYDNTKKALFEQHFINHFYLREIGSETVGRFKHYLKNTFTEKLPYYNELFRTANITYDKLNKVRTLTEDTSKNVNNDTTFVGGGTNILDGTGNDTNEHKHLDTPQGNVGTITDTYLTDLSQEKNDVVSHSEGITTNNATGTNDTSETFSKTLTETSPSLQAENLLKHLELQKELKDIELRFFEECNELFMLIY